MKQKQISKAYILESIFYINVLNLSTIKNIGSQYKYEE